MRNIKLIIKYDGSRYYGWQRLTKTDMTIQYKIEQVLSQMANEEIQITASGRTDAGVHALGQVANFKTNSRMTTREIQDYLYRYLPEDIGIEKVEEVDERFHSRYNAIGKTYSYRIWNNRYSDPFLRKYVEHIPEKLNIGAMEKAANFLKGEHDFSSFRSTRSKKKSSVRTIHTINIVREGNRIEILVKGDGFLYNMVRIIVGTLIEVGLGRMKPEEIKKILEDKDRTEAGPTASAKGLFLLEVEY